MKSNKLFGVIAAVGLLFTHFSCQQEQKIPRIGIAGIAIECSTFSPAVSDEADDVTKELYSIWSTASEEERAMLLDMARVIKSRRKKG